MWKIANGDSIGHLKKLSLPFEHTAEIGFMVTIIICKVTKTIVVFNHSLNQTPGAFRKTLSQSKLGQHLPCAIDPTKKKAFSEQKSEKFSIFNFLFNLSLAPKGIQIPLARPKLATGFELPKIYVILAFNK